MIKNVFDEYIAGGIPRNIFLFSTFERAEKESITDKTWIDCRGDKTSIFNY